jgi:hypothetical protein
MARLTFFDAILFGTVTVLLLLGDALNALVKVVLVLCTLL